MRKVTRQPTHPMRIIQEDYLKPIPIDLLHSKGDIDNEQSV